MKLAKSLLLGSAAGLCAVAGAQAADLPVRKAAPVEFVRVCTTHGAGFFYIPGTDTCLRVSGRARFEFQGVSARQNNVSPTGYRTQGRLNLDARTSTAYGTLRTFIRFEGARRTGHHFSGTANRRGEAEIGTGQDFFNQAHTLFTLDKAFIQFAGLTAGRATSFFDFYGNDHAWFGIPGSARDSTNLLAYTASFGSGWSATISMEDPLERRYPLTSGLTGTIFNSAGGAVSAIQAIPALDPITGAPTGVLLGSQQVNEVPDFVGTLRVDQAWGSAQLSAAMHQVRVGGFATPFAVGVAPIPGVTTFLNENAALDSEYGWAVQGGVKLNLPFIAAGDNLYLQAAYAEGGLDYTISGTWAFGSATGAAGFGGASTGRFSYQLADGIIDPFRREIRLTESFSALASFLHYWTPTVRQAIFGAYAEVDIPSLNVPAGVAVPATLVNANNVGLLRDFSFWTVGTNLIWSPVKDLDIGVEVMYDNTRLRGPSVVDQSSCTVAGCFRRTNEQDTWYGRLRVQRDF
jgi:hypothetical protein